VSQEISGVSDTLPLGNDTVFEETNHRKGHRIPGGSSTVSTIQPYVDHRMIPQLDLKRGGNPFVSSKSKRDYTTTFLLTLFTWKIGGHDFYAGNTGKGISKVILLIPTLGLYPLISGIIDLIRLCNGTYQDGDGKYIKP